MLERINQELKRRTLVVRIFPNAAACLRLVRALAVEIHENWIEAMQYLNMDPLQQQKKASKAKAGGCGMEGFYEADQRTALKCHPRPGPLPASKIQPHPQLIAELDTHNFTGSLFASPAACRILSGLVWPGNLNEL